MGGAPHHQVQRNEWAGVEQVVHTGRKLSAVAVERLAFNPFAGADFVVAVRKPAAGHANAQVGIGAQQVAETQFGIQVGGRDRQPQCEIGAQKIRVVVVVEGVARQWFPAFVRLVVAELNEVARDRVDLGRHRQRGQQRQPLQN